jgi:hypothetical protein
MRILRHSKVGITMEIYSHPTDEQVRKARKAWTWTMLAQSSADMDLLLVAGGGRVVDAQSPPASRCGGAGLCFGGLPAAQDGGGGGERGHVPPVEAAVVGIGRANSVMIPAILSWAMTGRSGWRTSW